MEYENNVCTYDANLDRQLKDSERENSYLFSDTPDAFSGRNHFILLKDNDQ